MSRAVSRVVVLVVAAAAAAACACATRADAATTSSNGDRTILLDGRPIFPIVLAQGPPATGATPWGASGVAETAAAGVNVFKVGPATTPWTAAEIANAVAWNQVARAHHAYTWINLSTVARAAPGSAADATLARVVSTLLQSPGGDAIAMWKGVDEPQWSGVQPAALGFSYCRVTARGDPAWCGGEPPLDRRHLWVTIEAPRGAAADLAPYASVTDIHGVDVYPVTLAAPAPDLHQVGAWTSAIASTSGAAPVWTTLQVCASGSSDGTGAFVLPTLRQERYMMYDAIVNGARALAFYGGNIHGCWNGVDAQYGWNWSFWQSVLQPLVAEVNAVSPLAPALLKPDGAAPVTADDGSTEVVARQGATVDELWLIAARSGAGPQQVTFGGLPAWAATGSVYTEGRAVQAIQGSLTDSFDDWGVHVYRFVEPPTLSALAPTAAAGGALVRLTGSGLASTTRVAFGGVPATFRVVSDTVVDARVPRAARKGAVSVTSPGGTAVTATELAVAPTPATPPRIQGSARRGHRLAATSGTWLGDGPRRFGYQWQRCRPSGHGCAAIPGATGRTILLTTRNVGTRLRVSVTAANDAGRARSRSGASALVPSG